MAREFDSPGLRELARVLQISSGSPQQVDIQDSIVQQTIDLDPFLRRGLTPAGSLGIFTATILNTHIGSDTITTDIDPYAPATTFVGNGYPPVIESELDVWLLAAHARNITGSGDFGGGFLGVRTDPNGMGWRNEATATVMDQLYATFNQEAGAGNANVLRMSTSGAVFIRGPIRIRRGLSQITFETVKSGVGAGSYKAFLTLGVFPAGMGQDVV